MNFGKMPGRLPQIILKRIPYEIQMKMSRDIPRRVLGDIIVGISHQIHGRMPGIPEKTP